jgi:VanZ family protein
MRLAGIAYFGAILLIVVLADAGELLHTLTYVHSIPWGDKALHLVLATGLGFFVNVIPKEPFVVVHGQRVQRGSLFVFPAVIAEEVSQRWIPGRTFDLRDMAANLIGLTIGAGIALARERRQRAPT